MHIKRTFEDIANDYDVAVSTVFDATSLVEQTLSAKFTLPKREELTKNPPELIIINTPEIEIEQPKKGLRILLRKENASYHKSTGNSRLSDLQYFKQLMT